MALRNTFLPLAVSPTTHRILYKNLTRSEYEQRSTKKMRTKKTLSPRYIVCVSRYFSLSLPPSGHAVHAFSREFALADGVAGAPGGAGAHMTVYAFGTPWTLFSYQTQTRSHQQIFLFRCDPIRTNASTREKNRHLQKKERKKNRGSHPS